MRLAGRLSAAIKVLDEVLAHHRPASVALQNWARNNRFAGSGDRAAIGNLVFDVLRRKASLAHRMQSKEPRALALATLKDDWGLSTQHISQECVAQYGPGALTKTEEAMLDAEPGSAPAWVAGNYPQWLHSSFESCFGERAVEQGRALAQRAPVDLRVNLLKTDCARVARALAKHQPAPGPLSPHCLRLPLPSHDGRHPNVEANPAHERGWYEVQDAGSQVAALLSGAQPGMQVADICAGAGGKTLAMAAMMQNKGQLHAWDADKHRLKPIIARLKRAGARNVQVIPADAAERIAQLTQRMDVVFVDAPCSGSGAWRRRPDSKWRLTPQLLDQRRADQQAVLQRAASLAKPAGRIVYVTCSVLPEENISQVDWFLAENSNYRLVPYAKAWRQTIGSEPPASADGRKETLLLTPASHSTDGFFVAVLESKNS